MKKLSFLALAAAGLLMVGCADKDVVVQEDKPVVTNEDGKQFIALNINLPVTNTTTRSTDVTDDNNYGDGTFTLADGLESEYTVNDATLIVFHPAKATSELPNPTEYNATYVAAYSINPEPWKMSDDHQVTDYSTKIVQKVGTTVQEKDLALVILNKNNLFSFENNAFKVGNVTFDGTKTFADLQSAIATAAAGGKNAADEMKANGFYMANAPLANGSGSTTTPIDDETKVQTLVEIKNVYETEKEARDGECAEIYVERGMAKVTVQNVATTFTLTTGYDTGTKDATSGDPVIAPLKVTLNGWVLDHTNSASYLVRSTEGHSDFIGLVNGDSKKYRYIGKSDITEGTPGDYKYRTYFAKDPNYTAAVTKFGEVIVTSPTNYPLKYIADVTADNVLSDKFGDQNPQYCFENTFDVAHQSIDNTTLVRLKVTVATDDGAADLYIINGNKSTIYKYADVEKLIQNKCVELVKAAGVEAKEGQTISSEDFVITLGGVDAKGYKNITGISFNIDSKVQDVNKVPSAANLLTAVTTTYKNNVINASGETTQEGSILCYVGGVSYYTIRIKHFGDQLTPWKLATSSITPVPSLATHSYPGWNGKATYDAATSDEVAKQECDNHYLGRYGVLRNNWYDINISSIKYLGEAVPVDYSNDETPDDEIDGYIAVQINILSWAKRTQTWDL